MLEVRNLTVAFGGLHALSKVSLRLERGVIYGLIGPNGAGKSTAINAITGVITPTDGQILLAGEDVTRSAAYERARLGVSRTFQNLALFASMSVRENVECGSLCSQSEEQTKDHLVSKAIRLMRLEPQEHELTTTQSLGTRKRIELARSIASNPRLLLLDEPAAGLAPEEIEEFATHVRMLSAGGTTILLIEHDMKLVMSLCQHIFVLDFGCLIADGSPAEIQSNAAVRAAYFGEKDELEASA